VGTGRRQFSQLVVAYLLFVAIGASNAPSPLYVIYQDEWHFAPVVLTAVFAVYAVAVLVSLLVAGPISDRRGRKPLLVAATVLLALSAVCFAAATNVAWLFVARSMQGLATGTITGAATAAMIELDPTANRRRASLLTTVAFLTGAAVLPLLFGILAEDAPEPLVLPYLVLLGLILPGLLLLSSVPETRTPEPLGRATGRLGLVQRPSVPRSIRFPFAAAGASVAIAWSVGSLYSALSGSIERQLLHINSYAVVGFLLFVYNGLGGAGQIAMRRWTARNAMWIGVIAVTVGMILVQLSASFDLTALFFAGTFAAGLGGGAALMGGMALVNEVAPGDHRAAVVSAFSIVCYLAVAVPVVGVGLLAGSTGLERATGIFTVVVAAGAAVVLAALHRLAPDPLVYRTDRASRAVSSGAGHGPGAE
jgi:MFS family permease